MTIRPLRLFISPASAHQGGGRMRRTSFVVTLLVTVLISILAVPASAAQAGPGVRSAAASPTLSVSSNLANRRYAAAGDRAYDLGSEDGRYPAMGFHTRGEMGGIWTPPIKLLDGIWFGINGQWIGPATSFTSGFGYVQMALPTTGRNRLNITRTDFAPDGRRAVEFGLTLTASNSAPFELNVDAHSELMSAYPWGSLQPRPSTSWRVQTRPASYRPRSPHASRWTASPRCRCRAILCLLPQSPGASRTWPTSHSRPTTCSSGGPSRVPCTPRRPD